MPLETLLLVIALSTAPWAGAASVQPAPAATSVPSPASTPQAAPSGAALPAPAESPSPASYGSPAPAPAATSSPTPFLYRFVPRQPDQPVPGTPQIFAVYLNDKKLHSEGPIDIKVSTSPDVVKVVSGSGGKEGIVPMTAPGDFETYSKLPKVPFIAKGMTIYLEITATGQSGAKTTVRVPVQIL
jgi:hypothetical protein